MNFGDPEHVDATVCVCVCVCVVMNARVTCA